MRIWCYPLVRFDGRIPDKKCICQQPEDGRHPEEEWRPSVSHNGKCMGSGQRSCSVGRPARLKGLSSRPVEWHALESSGFAALPTLAGMQKLMIPVQSIRLLPFSP